MKRASAIVLSALFAAVFLHDAAACGPRSPASPDGLALGEPGTLPLEEIRVRARDPSLHTTFAPETPFGITTSLYGLVPGANPLTRAKVELGQQLFFDARLSRDGHTACASCHHPSFGWAGGAKQGGRNAPALANRLLGATQYWDGRAATLEEQALSALGDPRELDSPPEETAARLNAIEGYRLQFEAVFGGPATPERTAKALAAFERTLVSGGSELDRDPPLPPSPPAVVETSAPSDDAGESTSAEASAAEPEPVESAAAAPAAAGPEATEPEAAEVAVAEATGAAPAESSATEPSATEPSATEPSATEPSATEPSATEPSATGTSLAESVAEPTTPAAPHAAPAPRLGDSARRGRELFFGKARCGFCHSGENLTDERFHNLGIGMDEDEPDLGRFLVTRREEDKGAFKTPSLRNIALTAPYMHDGSLATLREVIEHHDHGGIPNPWLSRELVPLDLGEEEKVDLRAFLEEALTGAAGPVTVPRLP